MIRKSLLVLILIFITLVSCKTKKISNQQSDEVLMTIENQPIFSSEFLRVYNKNKDVVSEENKKDIHEYLELFINYKLKLRDAKDLKLDTIQSYKKEFNKYKEQLLEPFLKDREVSDFLVKEAYERSKKEVKASHILVLVKPNAKPNDTLNAYNKVLDARNLILSGKAFEEVAKKYSEDPSVKDNGGNLGYFSAFGMVYPFENAAFNTKVGEVSMPFRTRYGFHILKVFDKRESKGEVKVAHIMIRDKKTDTTFAKKQIEDIYNKFSQGESFEKLAKKYSDDKASAAKGGVIRKFTQGKMIQPFADISFALENKGDVSKPFETKFGWHILKLIDRYPIGTFENLKESLTQKVEKGERSVLIGKSIANKLKTKYQPNFNTELYNRTFNQNKINNDKNGHTNLIENNTILTIKDKKYTVSNLRTYLDKNPSKNYNDFIDDKLIAYYKENLELENLEFAATLQEYRDGLLLFDLLQKKIWTKAEKDTIGLQNFFDKNVTKYVWKKRMEADIASSTKQEKADLVLKYMNQGKTVKEIKELVNEGATIHVLFNSGTYEIGSDKLPNNFIIQKGAKIYKEDDANFTIVNTLKILESSPKELTDVKGKVISDYQDYLEKEWIKELRGRYTVNVNKKVFEQLVKNNND